MKKLIIFYQVLCLNSGIINAQYVINPLNSGVNQVVRGSFYDTANNKLYTTWDGIQWDDMGLPFGNLTNAQVFVEFNNELWLSVYSDYFLGNPFNEYSAKYNAITGWDTTGLHFNNAIMCFAQHNNDLYMGGGFTQINGMPFNRICKYSLATGLDNLSDGTPTIKITPNPAGSFCTITSTLQHSNTLTVHDLTGRVLLQQAFNTQAKLNLSTFSAGMYVIEMRDMEGRSVKGKMLKQ